MLKEIYLDAIVEGSNYVITRTTGNQVIKGDQEQGYHDSIKKSVTVAIGINGSIQGEVFFTVEEHVAYKIASQTIGAAENMLNDEIAHSCLAELGNMIMGVAVTKISKVGIEANITPPVILPYEQKAMVQVEKNGMEIISLPLIFHDGQVIRINTYLDIEAA